MLLIAALLSVSAAQNNATEHFRAETESGADIYQMLERAGVTETECNTVFLEILETTTVQDHLCFYTDGERNFMATVETHGSTSPVISEFVPWMPMNGSAASGLSYADGYAALVFFSNDYGMIMGGFPAQ